MKSVFLVSDAEPTNESLARFTIDIWYINRQSEQIVTPPLTRDEYEVMIAEIHQLKQLGVVAVPLDLSVMNPNSVQSIAAYPARPDEVKAGQVLEQTRVNVWSTHFLIADTINRIQVIPTGR